MTAVRSPRRRVPVPPGFTVAETFTALYDGEQVTFNRGEWVAAGHEIVKEHSSRFARAGTKPLKRNGGARRRRATVPAPAGRVWKLPGAPARPMVEVRLHPGRARSPFAVAISADARSVIGDIAWTTRSDGLEAGSILLGVIEGHTLKVTAAAGSGPRAMRFATRYLTDAGYDMEAELTAIERSHGQVAEIGHTHTHPSTGSFDPSPADLSHWGAMFCLQERKHGHAAYLGLIATPDCESPSWPRLLIAHVVRRGRNGELVAERATVR